MEEGAELGDIRGWDILQDGWLDGLRIACRRAAMAGRFFDILTVIGSI